MSTHATAQLRYLRIAPRKARAAADVIRGLPVAEAEAQLMLMPRRAATPLLKLLRSASANAKQTMKRDAEALFIKEIRVDQGPKSTRWMPRARGAMSPIERKTCHVSIALGLLAKPSPARFSIRRPEKRTRRDQETSRRAETKQKTAAEKKPEPEKKESPREEAKEKGRGAAGSGFMKRIFRRKAI